MTTDSTRTETGIEAEGASAEGRFEGEPGLKQALYRALRRAERDGVRRLEWCDPDFQAWPIGEAEFIDTLTRWAHGGTRELAMVAADFEAVRRRHPRFVEWRRDFAHLIACLVPDDAVADNVPTLWTDSGGHVVRVFDRTRWRGRAGADRHDRQAARESFDAIAQRAVPGFGVYTTGL